MNKQVLPILSKFALSLASLVIAIVRIYQGYIPSSKIVKYDNISAADKPVSFWITIAFLLIVSVVLFVWGTVSAIRYRKSI
ncbi:MAG: hypothetical protein K1X72_27125 [Pyrinomonadaceae bacterium]|nr:hypothetical protein [Pyrinomonadaceae bacterium]